MTAYYQISDDTISIASAPMGGYGIALDDAIQFAHQLPTADYGVVIDQEVIGHDILSDDMLWGPSITDKVKLTGSTATMVTFNVTRSEEVFIRSMLQTAYPMIISQNFTVGQTSALMLGWVLNQRMTLHDSPSAAASYGLALTQAISMSSALAAFFGKSISETFHVTNTSGVTYLAQPSLSDNVNVHATLSPQMVFNLTSSFDVNITDVQLLQMIYDGVIDDDFQITALHVSPDGEFTTWAINTRTAAVTEYQDFYFNSYAQMGLKYIAANETGLYELDGPTDVGENIVSVMRSGLFAPGDMKFTAFTSIYLGIRAPSSGVKDFMLKLIAGDGREYIYAFQPQPGLMTSKINVGKGLRSRYFAFELTTPGADWDLDAIEFIPLISRRRV